MLGYLISGQMLELQDKTLANSQSAKAGSSTGVEVENENQVCFAYLYFSARHSVFEQRMRIRQLQ